MTMLMLLSDAERIVVHQFDTRRWRDLEAVKTYLMRLLGAQPEGGRPSPGVYWAEMRQTEILASVEFAGGEGKAQDRSGQPLQPHPAGYGQLAGAASDFDVVGKDRVSDETEPSAERCVPDPDRRDIGAPVQEAHVPGEPGGLPGSFHPHIHAERPGQPPRDWA